MFLISLFQLLIAFIITYYTSKLGVISSMNDRVLGDWVSYAMSNGDRIILVMLLLLFVLFLIHKPTSYMISILKGRTYSYYTEKWKGIITLLLIFDLYFYLFIKFQAYFFVPLFLYASGKYLLTSEENRSVRKSFF